MQPREIPETDTEAHLKFVKLTKIQNKVQTVIVQRFDELKINNKKSTEQKKQENQEFNDALDLACVLNEIKLYIHFSKLIENMLEMSLEKEIFIQQQYQRFIDKIQSSDNPYPLMIPQKNDSPKDFNTQVLAEALATIARITDREAELENEMREAWGDTWEAGLKIHTDTVHENINERINNLEFLTLLTKPDGRNFNPENIDNADIHKVKAEFNNVNDALRAFYNEKPMPAPARIYEFKITEGESAPQAPALEKSDVKPVENSTPRKSQLKADEEIFLIEKFMQAFKNAGKHLEVNSDTKIQSNDSLRSAMKFTNVVSKDIQFLHDKINKVARATGELLHLGDMKTEAQHLVEKIENNLGSRDTRSPGRS
jgi:hypothetical protein